MKTKKITAFALLATVFSIIAAFGASRMSIQIKSGHLRNTPSFLGRIVSTLSYGDRVDFFEEKNSWSHVGVPGTQIRGWIHATALTSKKIILSAGAEDVEKAATSDELALAGKGFNRQVEEEFKQKNRHIDYHWIDKMEHFVASQDQIRRFVENGALSSRPEEVSNERR